MSNRLMTDTPRTKAYLTAANLHHAVDRFVAAITRNEGPSYLEDRLPELERLVADLRRHVAAMKIDPSHR